MNVSCCVVVFLAGLTLGVSPFSIVQLLLINLVMDMFAALALATEPPRTRALRGKPVRDGDAIMTNAMWTQIFGQGLYISLVTLIILWAGPAFYGQDAGYGTVPATVIDNETLQSNKTELQIQGETVLKVHTMAFNTFMFMHFFNQFCCRKVNSYEWNMFERFFNNPLFLVVMLIQIVFFWACSYFGPMYSFAGNREMSSEEWATVILLGMTVLISCVGFKALPEKITNRIPKLVNENAGCDDNKFMKAFNKISKPEAKVTDDDGPA
jgi:Ca2+-transporting ATPase